MQRQIFVRSDTVGRTITENHQINMFVGTTGSNKSHNIRIHANGKRGAVTMDGFIPFGFGLRLRRMQSNQVIKHGRGELSCQMMRRTRINSCEREESRIIIRLRQTKNGKRAHLDIHKNQCYSFTWTFAPSLHCASSEMHWNAFLNVETGRCFSCPETLEKVK